MGYFCSIFGCWALTSVESGPTLLRVLEHRFSCNKPPLRCVGWDWASFPVLRRRWVFSCIFYTICCSSGFLGEFGSCTEVSPVSLNRDFSTLFHFRDGKKSGIALYGSLGGAAFFHGRSGIVFSKAFLLANALCDQNWDELFFSLETWPCCHLQRKRNPGDLAVQRHFNKAILCLAGRTETSGGRWDFAFPCFEAEGWGAGGLGEAFSRIRCQEWLKSAGLD